MKLNRISPENIETLLDLIISPEAAQTAKDRVAQIRTVRDETNAAIDAHNERETKLQEWEIELSQMDKTFDGQRAEIRSAKEELKRGQAALAQGRETLEAQKVELASALDKARAREAVAASACEAAAEMTRRAERLRSDATDKAAAAENLRLEYEAKLADAEKLFRRA